MRFFSGSNWDVKKVFLATTMFLGLIGLGNAINNDVWFMLNVGRYIEAHGIPHVEPFTIHEGLHLVVQQWLFALALWKLYAFGGLTWLVVFTWVAGIVLICVFFRLAYLVSKRNFELSAILTFFVGRFICTGFVCQRPQVVSSLIFLIEIYLLEYYSKKQSRWIFLLFPLLSILLINLHAAMWPMAFVFLLPYLIEAVVCRNVDFLGKCNVAWTWQKLSLLGTAMFFAAFLNPNGIEAITYTYYSYGVLDIKILVAEMDTLSIYDLFGIPFISMIIVTSIYSRNKVPLHYILLTAGTALMSMMAVRSLFLYFLFGFLGIAYVYRDWKGLNVKLSYDEKSVCIRYIMLLALSSVSILTLWKNRLFLKECIEGRYWGGTLVIVVICALLLMAVIAFLWRRKFSELGSLGLIMAAFSLALVAVIPIKCQMLNVPPVQKSWEDCVQILLDSAPPEQLSVWTGYGEGGGYFEFHGIPCYLDARAEVFLPAINHKENILHEYVLLRKGLLDYREHLQKYSFTHIFVSSFDPLYEYLLHDSDYVLLYDSDEAGTTEDVFLGGLEPRRYRLYEVKK
ncbi:MAG: hypothetical protein ACI3U2_07695 [Anaerovibrio sp.]